jgi:hypothetical protein
LYFLNNFNRFKAVAAIRGYRDTPQIDKILTTPAMGRVSMHGSLTDRSCSPQSCSGANETKTAELDAQQKALKLCANATSYGIFVELNVTEQDKPQEVTCHGPSRSGFPRYVCNLDIVEKPIS